MTIFFRYLLFNLIKPHCRNLTDIRKCNIQNLQFFRIILSKHCHHVLQESRFHCHNIFKSIDVTHLEIQTGVLIQMTLGVMFFCPEYRCCLKYSVKHADHHLLVKLRTLLQYCRSVEIIQTEQVRSALCTLSSDLRCMNLRKSLFIKKITKCSCNAFLQFELCPFSHITQCDRSVVQLGIQ